MRRATGATHGGASTSIAAPECFRRERSGCAISASPIQLGATTRTRDKLMPLYGRALVDVLRAAIGAEGFPLFGDVEKYARMQGPERRARLRAVQRQVLLAYFDLTGVSHLR